MLVAKLHRNGQPQFWQVSGYGAVAFDSRPGWVLLTQPIGGLPKEIQWVPPGTRFEWVRNYTFK